MPSTINLQNVQIKNGSTWYTMCPFPVGYIYLSSNSTSPASTYGGTWSALNEDRFLRPSNAWGTGGSKTININQIPSHGHALAGYYYPIVTGWGEGVWFGGQSSGNIGVDQRRLGETQGGGRITGNPTAIVTLGTELLNLYLLDGGEE